MFFSFQSNSSIDSIDTIPFANENTGTIKQRLLNRQELSGNASCSSANPATVGNHLHSSSSSSSSSSTNTIANIAHSFHSLKSSSSLHDASLIRSESIGSTGSAGMPILLRSPTLQYPAVIADSAPSLAGLGGGGGGVTGDDNSLLDNETSAIACISNSSTASATAGGGSCASGSSSVAPQTTQQKVSANVLNDIGNMLANLTDELDAMLEEEKRVGLNIDSE